MAMVVNRFDVYLINLDPAIGSEIQKARPCLIISPDEMNRFLQTIVIAPVTSTSKTYPTRIPIKQGKTKGWVVLDQLRTIDRRRIVKAVGTLNAKEIIRLKGVMKETFVD